MRVRVIGEIAVLVRVAVFRFIPAMHVAVGVGVRVRVRVHQIAVSMCVGVDVGMSVLVLQGNGVFDNQHRGCYHQPKSDVEHPDGELPQKQETEKDA